MNRQRFVRAAVKRARTTADNIIVRAPFLALLVTTAVAAVFAPAAAAFTEPKVLASKNGVLKTTFIAEEGPATVDGKTIHGTMTINKQYPGPTLKLKPGDRVEIKYVNRLREATNLHFHGLHVSPAGRADNVLRRFRPGTTNIVSLRIPHDHPNGLYWYHPHLHGQVNTQVLRGMAGMISIEGGSARVKKLAKYRKRNIGLTLMQYDQTGTQVINPNDQNDFTATTLVNGKLGQRIRMRPGRTELWRVANMSNEGFYRLHLEGHKVWIVGQDGNPTRVAQNTSQFVIAPGSRYEFLVRPAKTGTFKFRQLQEDVGGGSIYPNQDLLTLNVTGRSVTSQRIPRRIKNFTDLSKAKVRTRRTWRISFTPNNAPVFHGLINGKAFDPDRIDTVAKIGDVEEWTFRNETDTAHPIHLHTNDFQVTKVNGKSRRVPAPIDNYILPANGSITFRFKPHTYTGVAVFHCHILFHEDNGMMATIKWSRGTAKASVRPARSVGAYSSSAISAKVFDPATAPDDLNPAEHSHGDGAEAEHRLHLQAVKASRSIPGAPNTGDPNDWLFCRLDEIQS